MPLQLVDRVPDKIGEIGEQGLLVVVGLWCYVTHGTTIPSVWWNERDSNPRAVASVLIGLRRPLHLEVIPSYAVNSDAAAMRASNSSS